MLKQVYYLNDILSFIYNSKSCYEHHFKTIHHTELKVLFAQINQQREQMINELIKEIRKYSGEPAKHATIFGTLHEIFENIKSFFTGRDPIAIAKEIRRGENFLIAKYQVAMSQCFYSDAVKIMLAKHMSIVDNNIRDMDAIIAHMSISSSKPKAKIVIH